MRVPCRWLPSAVVLVFLVLMSAGCQTAPSAVQPRGVRAAQIADLWWIELALGTAVFVVVMAVLLVALFRPRRGPAQREEFPPPITESGRLASVGGLSMVVVGGVIVPAIILVVLFVLTLRSMAVLAAPPTPAAFTIEVSGHQFWWEIRYPDYGFITANEIHIPVGQPVRLRLTGADVIHSFWVPQLMGKHDLIPGRTVTSWIQADEPGVYWGECAEYCGIQHAKMAFLVVAEPVEEFEAWLVQQQLPAHEPTDPLLLQGAAAFAREECIKCHAIRYGNVRIGGTIGPDLTHVGSRLTIGAGILPNTLGNLQGWISNPQAIKPGNNMPVIPLDAETLRALAYYLQSLK